MEITDMEGFWGNRGEFDSPFVKAVEFEPLTDDDLRSIIRAGATNKIDTNNWHECIALVIVSRVYNKEIYDRDLFSDFVESEIVTCQKKHIVSACIFMMDDFVNNPHKVKEAWSWFRLGAEIPDLTEYYVLVDQSLPSLEDLGSRIEETRRRLLG